MLNRRDRKCYQPLTAVGRWFRDVFRAIDRLELLQHAVEHLTSLALQDSLEDEPSVLLLIGGLCLCVLLVPHQEGVGSPYVRLGESKLKTIGH